MTEPRRGQHDPADPTGERPQLDKRGLLNVSVWWLLLWIVLAIAALVLAEQLGIFGA